MFSVTKMDPQVIILLINISCTWKSHLRMKVMINTVSSSMCYHVAGGKYMIESGCQFLPPVLHCLWSVPNGCFLRMKYFCYKRLCFYRCFPVHYSNPYKCLLYGKVSLLQNGQGINSFVKLSAYIIL